VVIVEGEKSFGGGMKRYDEWLGWRSGGHWLNVQVVEVIELE